MSTETPPIPKVEEEIEEPSLAEGLDKDFRYEPMKDEMVARWEDEHGSRFDKKNTYDFAEYSMGSQMRDGDKRNLDDRAKEEFSQRFPEDAQKYIEIEKKRVYDNPEDDPAIKETKIEAIRLGNVYIGRRPEGHSFQEASSDQDLGYRRAFESFAVLYPEKAKAYAEKVPEIKNALDFYKATAEREKQQREIDEKEKLRPKTLEDDTRFYHFMNNAEDGINARVWRNVSPDESLTIAQYDEKEKLVREQMMREFEEKHPDIISQYANPEIKDEKSSDVLVEKELLNDFDGIEKGLAHFFIASKRKAINLEQRGASIAPADFKKERDSLASDYKKRFEKSAATFGIDKMAEVERKVNNILRERGEFKPLDNLRGDASYSANIEAVNRLQQESEEYEDPEKKEVVGSAEKKTEGETSFVKDQIIESDLSYQDADVPEETKAKMLEWSQTSESASKYAGAIEEMARKKNLLEVREIASNLLTKMSGEADRLGIPVSEYGKSLSWAMWDIGKQYYYFKNVKEADPNYDIGNPLESDEKQQEIINRHLGFEAYKAYSGGNNSWFEKIKDQVSKATKDLLEKKAKSNGTLSSLDLAELGKLLRSQ